MSRLILVIFYQSVFLSNSFVPNAPFLYPLDTSENIMFFWCFQGVEKWCIGNKSIKCLIYDIIYMMNYENFCVAASLTIGRETENTFIKTNGGLFNGAQKS